MARRTRWSVLLIGTVVAAGAAGAQPDTLRVRHLTPADGLADVTVVALASEGGGFVWVGTPDGADLYDGARFQPLIEGLPAPLNALAAGSAGTLWVGTNAGIVRWDEDRRRLGPVRDLGAPVQALAGAPGEMWAGTRGGGLVRLGRTGNRRYRHSNGYLASDSVRVVAAEPDGAVIVATTGGVSRVRPGKQPRHARGLRDVVALTRLGGVLWAGRSDGTLLALDPVTLAPSGRGVRVGAPVTALFPSASFPGRAWVGTEGGGLFLLDGRRSTLQPVALAEDGVAAPFNHRVLAIHERNQSLWIGTTNGIFQADVTPPRFEAVSYDPDRPWGLRTSSVMSVHASRRAPGMVWVGTVSGGLHRYDLARDRAEVWFDELNHPLSLTFAIHESPDGAVWLGGSAPVLYRFEPDGALEAIPLGRDGGGYVTNIAPVRGDPEAIWVMTSEHGVFRVDRATRRVTLLPGIVPEADPVHVYELIEPAGEPGVLYAATYGAGLVRADLGKGQTERVQPETCTLDDRLIALVSTVDGALWAGSDEGRLFRVDPRTGGCHVWDADDGLPDARVSSLFVDERERLWVSTMSGLALFDPEAEVFTRFSAADGMPEGALYFHAHDQTPDGRILVGGAGGFAAFDPLDVPVDAEAAPVRITAIAVDGEPAPLADALGGLSLGHRLNDVAIAYAALDLRQPEKTRYRVRLGIEAEWEPEGTETRYASLAPGRYTFQVSATNRDGYWSEPTTLAIRIRPPYWQTPWFWALIALALGAVGYAAHRYRVEQLLRVERTRRRIADDLHDDIGSKISSVALRLDAAQRSPAIPEPERDRLDRLGATARSVVADLRDTVWLVDAGHDDLRSVADRMEQFATQTLGGRVERGDVPAVSLGMEARRDLYLLFTEALHNAVRHAEADEVTVRLGVEDGVFRLEVVDDGRGFDPEAGDAGRGMDTMRRRAEALRGDLSIDASPGQGTHVTLSTPLDRLRRLPR